MAQFVTLFSIQILWNDILDIFVKAHIFGIHICILIILRFPFLYFTHLCCLWSLHTRISLVCAVPEHQHMWWDNKSDLIWVTERQKTDKSEAGKDSQLITYSLPLVYWQKSFQAGTTRLLLSTTYPCCRKTERFIYKKVVGRGGIQWALLPHTLPLPEEKKNFTKF